MTHPNADQKADIAKTLGLDDAVASKSRLKRWLAWSGAAVVALVVGQVWLSRSKANVAQYETQPVRRGDLVVTVSATGRLEPIKKVDVGIEVSGTIKTVEADYNDRVEVGQVLARLDTSRLEAQALQSEAAVKSAQARVAQALASVKEAEANSARLIHLLQLSGGKMPSQSDLDTARAALDSARADQDSAIASVAQAQATRDVNRTDLSKAVIRSPINGVVLTRAVEPGQTVTATFQSPVLFTLAEDLSQLELQVNVDEADVGRVRQGQDATFTVDAYPDRIFPARVARVRFGSEIVNGVVTYKTVL
jgi:HlyD family secretion protein